jgi:hypothetical protein
MIMRTTRKDTSIWEGLSELLKTFGQGFSEAIRRTLLSKYQMNEGNLCHNDYHVLIPVTMKLTFKRYALHIYS